MNVLNIHSYPFGLFSKNRSFNGGGEKVAYDTHEILKNHINIKTFSSEWDNLGNGYLPILPHQGLEYWKENSKSIKRLIISTIQKEKPDVIINHGSDKLLKLTNSLGIPSLFIDHRSNEIHKLYHESFFTKDAFQNYDIGGKIYTVSDFSRKIKEETIEKFWGNGFKYNGFINFQYMNTELQYEEVEKEKRIITIGRCDGTKSPHRIEKLSSKLKLPYTVITALPDVPKKDTQEYWDKYFDGKDILDNTLLNIDRKRTVDELKKSKIYYSTSSIESAGITAFESFSQGIPVILYAPKEIHASTMYMENRKGFAWEYYTGKNIEVVEEFVKRCLSYTTEHSVIAEECAKNNSEESTRNSLLAAIMSIKKVELESPLGI